MPNLKLDRLYEWYVGHKLQLNRHKGYVAIRGNPPIVVHNGRSFREVYLYMIKRYGDDTWLITKVGEESIESIPSVWTINF